MRTLPTSKANIPESSDPLPKDDWTFAWKAFVVTTIAALVCWRFSRLTYAPEPGDFGDERITNAWAIWAPATAVVVRLLAGRGAAFWWVFILAVAGMIGVAFVDLEALLWSIVISPLPGLLSIVGLVIGEGIVWAGRRFEGNGA